MDAPTKLYRPLVVMPNGKHFAFVSKEAIATQIPDYQLNLATQLFERI